jgi:ComF family protein
MKKIISNLIGLFYPNICLICNENLNKSEQQICLKCMSEIPRTNFHLQKDNPVEKRFWGKADIQKATAFFFFTKGSPFQKLLHELKYRDNKEIGELMGSYAATDLLDDPDFAAVDFIIPIPLHPKKFVKRGYNQSELICNGLAKVFNKRVDTKTLRRIKENTTQTKKSVFERYENTAGIFEVVDTNVFANKHIMLVDDVLTTGSTIEAAIQALKTCEGIKVSIFTLAIA